MGFNIRRALRSAIRSTGFDLHRLGPSDKAKFGSGIDEIIHAVSPYTTTGAYRIAAVCDAINYVEQNKIEGAFVECGVWRGGSSMAAAFALKRLGSTSRKLYLYDTYEGMPAPTEFDTTAHSGEQAGAIMARTRKGGVNIWRIAQIDEVRENIGLTEYPDENLVLVKGLVEDTIPGTVPERIAVLRLDTDWYESTKHELEHLYPRLVPGGVLILDDYGHWQGARKAVDEYFADKARPLLARIDYTGRMAVKV